MEENQRPMLRYEGFVVLPRLGHFVFSGPVSLARVTPGSFRLQDFVLFIILDTDERNGMVSYTLHHEIVECVFVSEVTESLARSVNTLWRKMGVPPQP